MSKDLPLLNWTIEEIIHSELFKASVGWTLAGAFLGLIIGLACYKSFRRLRWYGAVSSTGRGMQSLLGVFTILACILLLGLTGLGEGLHRQVHTSILSNKLGTGTLSFLSDEIADNLVWVDLALQQRGNAKPAELNAALADFRAGKREFPAKDFLQRLDQTSREIKQDMLAALETKLLQSNPKLPAWATKLIREGMQELGTVVLERRISAEMSTHGLARVYVAVRESMVAEAACTGDPRTIGRKDLSALLLREGLIPAIVAPIQSFIRQQQAIALLVAALICFLPALLCRMFRPAERPPAQI